MVQIWRRRGPLFLGQEPRQILLTPVLGHISRMRRCSILLECPRLIPEQISDPGEQGVLQDKYYVDVLVDFDAIGDEDEKGLALLGDGNPWCGPWSGGKIMGRFSSPRSVPSPTTVWTISNKIWFVFGTQFQNGSVDELRQQLQEEVERHNQGQKLATLSETYFMSRPLC